MIPKIDPDRLVADLRTLRKFGATENGVVRPSYSDLDMAARRWLVGRMEEAGLAARIDGVGNVIGRSPNAGWALLMGSHSDTQPRGGWLDGAMGVIYALEVARALLEDPESRHLPLDIGSWMDEEGSYFGCLGSVSFTEGMPDETIRAGANVDGRTVGEAIAAVGLADEAPARLEPARHAGYLEAHIEQGPVLEAEGKRIGVVTSIVGIRTFLVSFEGMQNHAGTTPMPLRRDAGDALLNFAQAAKARLRELSGERSVFTIGRVAFDPGADSIIPGRAEMTLQFRDPEESRLDEMEAAIHALVAETSERGPVTVRIGPSQSNIVAAAMDPGFQDQIAAAAEAHAPDNWIRMPSGAGHDAQVFARRVPSAMLFIPSIGGVSHDFAEDSHEDDIALGCQVLATATASILRDLNPG